MEANHILLAFVIVLFVVASVVAAFLSGTRRGERNSDVGFIAGHRVEERGWWVWKSFRLYGTVQYTFRGIPIGPRVEHLIRSVSEVNEEALKEIVVTVSTMALGAPVPPVVLKEAKTVNPTLRGRVRPAHVGASAVDTKAGSRSRQSKTA
jgi:hypothetical protein